LVATTPIALGLVKLTRAVLGLDEAGRGAVLGPLVVAGVLVPEDGLARLVELGARDSKAVPRERRRGLLAAIVQEFWIRTVVIPAKKVDEKGLTELELIAAARIVRYAVSTICDQSSAASSSPPITHHPLPITVVMDAPVAPRAIPAFRASLASATGLPEGDFSIYPKADSLHPAVSAASLAAKVIRDAYVVFLHKEYGDFGWGYPGEGKVVEFLTRWLAERGELPSICRTRWRTAKRLLEGKLPL